MQDGDLGLANQLCASLPLLTAYSVSSGDRAGHMLRAATVLRAGEPAVLRQALDAGAEVLSAGEAWPTVLGKEKEDEAVLANDVVKGLEQLVHQLVAGGIQQADVAVYLDTIADASSVFLADQKADDAKAARATVATLQTYLKYLLTTGQEQASATGYVGIPSSLQTKALAQVDQIKAG